MKKDEDSAGLFGYCAICYHPLDLCSHCDSREALEAVKEECQRLARESNANDQIYTLGDYRDPARIGFMRGEQSALRQMALWCEKQLAGHVE